MGPDDWKIIKVRRRVHQRLDELRKEDLKHTEWWYDRSRTFGEAIEQLIKFYDEHKPEDVEEVEP